MPVKHAFVSQIPDDPVAAAAGQILPSHWNASLDTSALTLDEVPQIKTVVDGKANASSIPTVDPLTLSVASPPAPAANKVTLSGRRLGGRIVPSFIGPSGLQSLLQPHFGRNRIMSVQATDNNLTTLSIFGSRASTGVGTVASLAVDHSSFRRSMRLVSYTTAATAGSVAEQYFGNAGYFRGVIAGCGGFTYNCRFSLSGTAAGRHFVGMRNSSVAMGNVDPSTLVNVIGVASDLADVNHMIIYNDATGTASKIDTGIPCNVADVLDLQMFAPPAGDFVNVTLLRYFPDGSQDTPFEVTLTTDLPAPTLALGPRTWRSNGDQATQIGIYFYQMYLETDNS